MKLNYSSAIPIFALAAMLAGGNLVYGQSSTTETTTTVGTISDVSPDTLVIQSDTGNEPLRYSYSKTTTYVDEAGNPVSIETVKSGLPVTVYYSKQGDRLEANRVVVHKKKTTSSSPVIEEKRTTTTTTEER